MLMLMIYSDAEKVRTLLDGQPVPGLPKRYRLNWAQFGVSSKYTYISTPFINTTNKIV
jgi:hypothetical protein